MSGFIRPLSEMRTIDLFFWIGMTQVSLFFIALIVSELARVQWNDALVTVIIAVATLAFTIFSTWRGGRRDNLALSQKLDVAKEKAASAIAGDGTILTLPYEKKKPYIRKRLDDAFNSIV